MPASVHEVQRTLRIAPAEAEQLKLPAVHGRAAAMQAEGVSFRF